MNKKDSTLNRVSSENDATKNHESFIIPNEAACSPEFPEGCIILEDEEDKMSLEKEITKK